MPWLIRILLLGAVAITALFVARDAPNFAVVRVFTDTTGWTPHYTGTDMADRFPAHT